MAVAIALPVFATDSLYNVGQYSFSSRSHLARMPSETHSRFYTFGLVVMFILHLSSHCHAAGSSSPSSSQLVADANRSKSDVHYMRLVGDVAAPSKSNSRQPAQLHGLDENLLAGSSEDLMASSSSSSSLSSSMARFLTTNGTVVIAQRGSTASLPCEVISLGDGVVTWFRRKDFHLLTVGHAVYSSDERFHVQGPLRSAQTQDWALQIRFVQERDAGLYECQLSTHPPSSLFVELVVVEARAEIDGGPEKYVKSGSTLRLTCHIRQNSVAPDFVFWYHDGRMINYEGALGVSVLGDAASSTLIVGKAHSLHSGNYSCVPSNVRPASVIVHILNGEKPAAMQHSSALSRWSSASLMVCLALISASFMEIFL